MGWYTFSIILWTVLICYHIVIVWNSKKITGSYSGYNAFWLMISVALLVSHIISGT